MLLIIFMQLKKIFSYVLTLIQNAINFGCITYKKCWRMRFGHFKWTYLKNYIDDYMICWNDK